MTKGDKLSLKNLMDDYTKYMRRNKNSLLPKFYGIYKKNNIVYVIQKNLNPYKNGTWVFDLKGSHRRRTVLHHTVKKIGKDNNFGDSKIFINNAKKIKKQMKKDSTFLKKHNLMDYSLLLCMRNKPVKEKDWKVWGKGDFCCDIKGPGPSKKSSININMGIIDILQKYNNKKFIESFFNLKGTNENADDISRMAIISGNTNIIFDGKYNIQNKIKGKDKFKVMTFNNSNNIEDKPDNKYVRSVENYFPGTIISARILINKDDII
jgi:hypothetical protein